MKKIIIWLLAMAAWILFDPAEADASVSSDLAIMGLPDLSSDYDDYNYFISYLHDSDGNRIYTLNLFDNTGYLYISDSYIVVSRNTNYGTYVLDRSGTWSLTHRFSTESFSVTVYNINLGMGRYNSSVPIYSDEDKSSIVYPAKQPNAPVIYDPLLFGLLDFDVYYSSNNLTLSWAPKYSLPLPADQVVEADNLRLKLDATVYYPVSGTLQSKDISIMSYNDPEPFYDYNASYTISDIVAYLTAKHNLPGAVALEVKAAYTQNVDGVVKYGPASSARVSLDRGYYWDSSGQLKKNTSQLDSKAVPTPQNFLVQRAGKDLAPNLFYASLNDPPDGWIGKWPIFIPDLTTGLDEFILTWTPPTENYTLNIFASLLLRQADGSYRELQVPYIAFEQNYPASSGKLVFSQQDLFAHVAVSKDLVGLIPDIHTQDYIIKSPVKVYVRYLDKDKDGNVLYGNAVTFTYNKETTGTIQYGEEAVDDESGGSMLVPDSDYNDQNTDWSGTNSGDINTTINGFLDAITKLPQLVSSVFSGISKLFSGVGQIPLLLSQLFPMFPSEFYSFFLVFLLISLVIGIFKIFRG